MLPHYILGLLKSSAFREGRDTSPDVRIYHWLRYSSCPPKSLVSYFYPRLLSLHDLPEECGSADIK